MAAPDEDDPTRARQAAELIAKHVKAMGGAAGYQRWANARMRYRAETILDNPDMQSSFRWTVVRRSDGALRVSKEYTPEVESYGTDGKGDFWWKQPRSRKAVDAPKHIEDELRLDGQTLLLLLKYEKLGYRAQVSRKDPNRVTLRRARKPAAEDGSKEKKAAGSAGKESAGKESAAGEQAAGEQANWLEFLFDPKTLMIRECSMMRRDPGATALVRYTIEYSDYRAASGIPVARKLRVLRAKRPFLRAEVTEVEIGLALEDAVFKRPR